MIRGLSYDRATDLIDVFDGGAQELGDALCLRDATARSMRRVAIKDL